MKGVFMPKFCWRKGPESCGLDFTTRRISRRHIPCSNAWRYMPQGSIESDDGSRITSASIDLGGGCAGCGRVGPGCVMGLGRNERTSITRSGALMTLLVAYALVPASASASCGDH